MSERVLRTPIAALAIAGLGVAGYLTYVHYAGVDPVCTGGGGCVRVQASEQSELAGVPVALLGLVAYALVLGSAAAPSGEAPRVGGALLGLTGLGFSGYLTYASVAVIEATCVWCLASAAIMAGLAVLTVARLLVAP